MGLNCITCKAVFIIGVSKGAFAYVGLSLLLLCSIFSTVATQKAELPLPHKDKRLHERTRIKVEKKTKQKTYLELNGHNSPNRKHKRQPCFCEGGNCATLFAFGQTGAFYTKAGFCIYMSNLKSQTSCSATWAGNIICLKIMFGDEQHLRYSLGA